MIADAHLPPHDNVIFDGDTAGKAGLRGDDDIFADPNIVSNVHKIVDFGTAADPRFPALAKVGRPS